MLVLASVIEMHAVGMAQGLFEVSKITQNGTDVLTGGRREGRQAPSCLPNKITSKHQGTLYESDVRRSLPLDYAYRTLTERVMQVIVSPRHLLDGHSEQHL